MKSEIFDSVHELDDSFISKNDKIEVNKEFAKFRNEARKRAINNNCIFVGNSVLVFVIVIQYLNSF